LIRPSPILIVAVVLALMLSGCAKTEEADDSTTGITFASDGLTLYGILDLPSARKGKIPAVVLIHGSGPQDRNETVGAVKPFQDIGRGLADRGIAVLRYDKRTLTYGSSWTKQQIIDVTVREEVLDDALAGVQCLRRRTEVDPQRIFVLGHSLGGWAAPLIAEQDPRIAGIIMLAPSAADFDKTFVRQVKYRSKIGAIPRETAEKLVSEAKQGFEALRAGKFPDDQFLLGASGKYWKNFLARNPVKIVTTLPQRVLILQGEKDYQVTVADDLPIWEKALKASAKKNYRIVRFPTHNHLFVSIEGESTGNEYGIPGHVDRKVIEAIAAWIESSK